MSTLTADRLCSSQIPAGNRSRGHSNREDAASRIQRRFRNTIRIDPSESLPRLVFSPTVDLPINSSHRPFDLRPCRTSHSHSFFNAADRRLTRVRPPHMRRQPRAECKRTQHHLQMKLPWQVFPLLQSPPKLTAPMDNLQLGVSHVTGRALPPDVAPPHASYQKTEAGEHSFARWIGVYQGES